MSADTLTKDETIRLQATEIERLTRCIEICEENNERIGAKIERLREQVAVWLECYKTEKAKREELIQRVREALGE